MPESDLKIVRKVAQGLPMYKYEMDKAFPVLDRGKFLSLSDLRVLKPINVTSRALRPIEIYTGRPLFSLMSFLQISDCVLTLK